MRYTKYKQPKADMSTAEVFAYLAAVFGGLSALCMILPKII